MRVLLLGGTDLTLAVAEALHAAGLTPTGLVDLDRTFPISYRPQGVANARFADLAGWCEARGVPRRRYQAASDIVGLGAETGADFLLAAGWYHMVPASARARFPRGAAGLHGSLLPKLRGGAPLNWAILLGLAETGVSLFALSDGVDDGPLYGQRRIALSARTTIGELVEQSRDAAAALVAECLPAIAAGRLQPKPQQGEPSYGLQRSPEDGAVDWRRPAAEIDRLVRAVGRPYPGAFGFIGERRMNVWRASIYQGAAVHGAPGQVFRAPGESDPGIVTGSGALLVHEARSLEDEDLLPELRKFTNQRLGGGAQAR